MKTPTPVTLASPDVRLEPLTPAHTDALARVGLDPELWRWIPTPIGSVEEMRTYVATALEEQQRGVSLPFAIVDATSGEAVGSTRFGNIDVPNCRLEIGWTWLAPAWQRSGANREAKLLMLTHAFDVLGCRRVEFKTDSNNEPSRTALLGIGATFEGIFRKHMVMPGDGVRHSAWYSVIDDEWPLVKAGLEESLRR